ncbi:MAG: hypothetical protein WC789_05845 [Lentisphaeria bacterium]|jgi:hypothetical protein
MEWLTHNLIARPSVGWLRGGSFIIREAAMQGRGLRLVVVEGGPLDIPPPPRCPATAPSGHSLQVDLTNLCMAEPLSRYGAWPRAPLEGVLAALRTEVLPRLMEEGVSADTTVRGHLVACQIAAYLLLAAGVPEVEFTTHGLLVHVPAQGPVTSSKRGRRST